MNDKQIYNANANVPMVSKSGCHGKQQVNTILPLVLQAGALTLPIERPLSTNFTLKSIFGFESLKNSGVKVSNLEWLLCARCTHRKANRDLNGGLGAPKEGSSGDYYRPRKVVVATR